MTAHEFTRRSVLGAAGGLLPGAGFPSPERRAVEVHVGYGAPTGRRWAASLARETLREFAFDALTVRIDRREARRLAHRDDVRYVEPVAPVYALSTPLNYGVDRVDADVARAGGPERPERGRDGRDRENDGDGSGAVRSNGDGAGAVRGDGDGPEDSRSNGDGARSWPGIRRDDGDGGGDEGGKTGDGAHIGVVDTGIAAGHGRLAPNVEPGKAFVPAGFFHFTPWDDDHGHGTHCAGVAAAPVTEAEGGGVAPDATLHPVKVLDGNGMGTTADVAAGIQYVANRGWDVANLSFAGSKSKVVEDACEYAHGRGVLLVAAAGPKQRGYPAREPECVAVGATGRDDEVADFSPADGSVDLLAPGVDIRSTAPGGYARRSGTSMACAFVSGAGAVLSADGYTHDEARARLAATAEAVGASEDAGGAGLLDVAAAVGFDSADN